MVVKKTLALTLMFLIAACSQNNQSKITHSSLGPKPAWMSGIFSARKLDASFAMLKSKVSTPKATAWHRLALARVYAVKKLYRLAELEYKAILQERPHLVEALMDLSSMRLTHGDYAQALKALEGLGNTNPHLMFDRALIHMQQNEEDLALQAINRCLYLNARDKEAMALKSFLFLRLRRYEEAKQLLVDNDISKISLFKFRDWSGHAWSPEFMK